MMVRFFMRIHKTRLVILSIFILWLFTWPFANAGYSGELPRNINLRIIHTNDLHGHLFPFDYDIFGETQKGIGGAARMATLIRQLRNSAAGLVLVMDAGDIYSRGPLGDLNGVPEIEIMNAVPYDVMALGNSEFRGTPAEKGLDILRSLINKAKFPVISANIFYKSSGDFFTLHIRYSILME